MILRDTAACVLQIRLFIAKGKSVIYMQYICVRVEQNSFLATFVCKRVGSPRSVTMSVCRTRQALFVPTLSRVREANNLLGHVLEFG